ncbi:TPA: OmpA family protein [Vibrio vulnificus]|nr:OmpA family protein [Vibrio vulnificus]HDY8012861.1 OmpA family protein [Vibrio vulnificus]
MKLTAILLIVSFVLAPQLAFANSSQKSIECNDQESITIGATSRLNTTAHERLIEIVEQQHQPQNISLSNQVTCKNDDSTLARHDSSVYFGHNSSDIRKTDIRELNKVIAFALENNHSVYLIGHTDSDGTEKYNDNLGLSRAKSVAQYLKRHGVTVTKLTSTGEITPKYNNQTSVGKQFNRRVDIHFM